MHLVLYLTSLPYFISELRSEFSMAYDTTIYFLLTLCVTCGNESQVLFRDVVQEQPLPGNVVLVIDRK